MAIKTKPIEEVVKKWTEVTPQRSGYYIQGAGNAGDDWEKGALAAASSFKAAVQSANIDKMFVGGIKKAGADKYNRKVQAVGESRFREGIAAGSPDYQAGMAPMLDTIKGITLPPRQPRGSEANLERVRIIARELNKKRLALRSAGA